MFVPEMFVPGACDARVRLTILGGAVAGKALDGRRAWRRKIAQRIVGVVVVTHLEVEIGAGGPSAGADLRDTLAARHGRALAYQDARVVAVDRHVVIGVTDDNRVAVAVELSRKRYYAGVGGVHRRAGWRRDVDAVMHRAVTHPEARGHRARPQRPRELARRARHVPHRARGALGAAERRVSVGAWNQQALADAEIARVAQMVGLQQALNADAVHVCDVIDGFAGTHDVLGRPPRACAVCELRAGGRRRRASRKY